MVSENDFSKITKEVIDRLEGGYYNPQWHSTGDSRYSASGETMFGIDRKAGGSINTTPAGIEFWNTIDKNKSKDIWKWNYKGGALNSTLKDLATKVMYPVYVKDSKNYLSDKAQAVVDSDPRLIFHFSYAGWNGPGWFKKFAAPINDAVSKGVTNTDELTKIAVKSRLDTGNSLIVQGGNKINSFINEFSKLPMQGVELAKEGVDLAKKKPLATVAVTAILLVSAYVLYSIKLNRK